MKEFRLLRADEIEARVATVSEKGCSVLLYKNARCDMNILDETVGPENWQRSHEVINGHLFCNVGIAVKRDGAMEWIWKQDVGTESYTEAEKGEASDSFKRACFNWGIGRELYTAPFIWFKATEVNIDTKNGKSTTYDKFKVEEIEYTDRKISWVKVVNSKTKAVYVNGRSRSLNEWNKNELITEEQAIELEDLITKADVNKEKLLAKYEVEDIRDLNMAQYTAIKNKAEQVIEEKAKK